MVIARGCARSSVSHLRRSRSDFDVFPALPGWAKLCRASRAGARKIVNLGEASPGLKPNCQSKLFRGPEGPRFHPRTGGRKSGDPLSAKTLRAHASICTVARLRRSASGSDIYEMPSPPMLHVAGGEGEEGGPVGGGQRPFCCGVRRRNTALVFEASCRRPRSAAVKHRGHSECSESTETPRSFAVCSA